jgi:beta-glucosidase
VAQLYVDYPAIAEGDEPPRQLKGFCKIMLAPHETKSVQFQLDSRTFAWDGFFYLVDASLRKLCAGV